MNITILCVGQIKEKYFRDAIAEYQKRLSRYCKLQMIEVADEKTVEHASEAVEDSIRSKEAERILKYVKEDAYVITLEINGEQLTSEQLAAKVEQLGIQGTSHLVFIIGGSIGLGKVSYTHLTLPTKRGGEISVVAGSFKKNRNENRGKERHS